MNKLPGATSRAQLPDVERLGFAVRLGGFYAALFLIYGMQVPYFPVWLDWRGLSPQQIAAVTGAPFFIRFIVTPLVAMQADRSGTHRATVIALSWISLALGLITSQMPGFWPLFLAAVPFALAISTIMPLTETICVFGVKSGGLDYGRMRLWGSLSFIGIGLVGGALVDRWGAGVGIWVIVVGAVTTVAAAHFLPHTPGTARAVKSDGSTEHGFIGAEVRKLVKSRLFLLFLLAAGAVQGAHGMFYTFGALHWRAQGISTAWVGALWAAGVLAEVLLFAYSRAVVARMGAAALITAGSAAAILRWGAMSLDPPLWLLFPIQLLHALTYGATHVGAIHFISRAVPEAASGTAQALYATVAAGLLMGGATLLSGSLYAAFGGSAYFAMAVLSAVGLAASVLVLRGWDGGALWDAEVSPTEPVAEAELSPPR
jgi:PPP family 3-phenylpropionic acid transporter